jgi:proline dehydrogenase
MSVEDSRAHAVSAALRAVARDETLKATIRANEAVYQALMSVAVLFIGGEDLASCVDVARTTNAEGTAVTIDFMGESTRSAPEAEAAVCEFLNVIRAISSGHLDASVSLDLSHIGLAVSVSTALANAHRLAAAAADVNIEMMINMEGSERTEDLLGVYRELSRQHSNIGITLQAYLLRTSADIEELLGRPGRIRLVKGAFAEPTAVALPRGAELDRAYLTFANRLITAEHRCSIATHDETLLHEVRSWVTGLKRPKTPFLEFEMLRGAAPHLLGELRAHGYRVREYLPYGQEWFLYVCHRVAEHPPHLYTAMCNLLAAHSRCRPIADHSVTPR